MAPCLSLDTQEVASTKLSPLTSFFISTSQLPRDYQVVGKVEYENVCYTLGGSFPWMLCRCPVLHSLNRGISLLLMQIPPPRISFIWISTRWNSDNTSQFHMPNSSELFYLTPHVDVTQPKRMLCHLFLNFCKNCDSLLPFEASISFLNFFNWTVCADNRICVGFKFVLFVLPVVSFAKKYSGES